MSDAFWMGLFGFFTTLITAIVTVTGLVLTYRKAASAEATATTAGNKADMAGRVAVAASKINTSAIREVAANQETQSVAIETVSAKQEQTRQAVAETTQAVADIKVVGTPDAHLTEQAASYKEIAAEAVINLELARDKKLGLVGKPIPKALAGVVPEHSSPTTRKQRETAELQTWRARLVAATLALELPAREASPDADESHESRPIPPPALPLH